MTSKTNHIRIEWNRRVWRILNPRRNELYRWKKQSIFIHLKVLSDVPLERIEFTESEIPIHWNMIHAWHAKRKKRGLPIGQQWRIELKMIDFGSLFALKLKPFPSMWLSLCFFLQINSNPWFHHSGLKITNIHPEIIKFDNSVTHWIYDALNFNVIHLKIVLHSDEKNGLDIELHKKQFGCLLRITPEPLKCHQFFASSIFYRNRFLFFPNFLRMAYTQSMFSYTLDTSALHHFCQKPRKIYFPRNRIVLSMKLW